MNKIIILTSLLLITFTGSLAAQNVGFSYQAVALDRSKAEGFGRDTEGEVLSSRNIKVRFSISEGSIEGTSVYQETHETTTDVFGMFRLIVGRGQRMSNKPIDELNWGNTAYFLHVEIDLNGQFEYLGAEELLGSPYALNVKNQTLELAGNQLSISEGNSVNLADNDATNEIQTLSKEGNELILSNGGGRVTMETGGVGNQELTREGNEITLSNNGGTVSIEDQDSDITNEIQDLQLIGNELKITNNSSATSIDLLKYLNDTQLSEGDLLSMLVENGYVTESNLTNYLTSNGYLTAEVDGDITNEIQDLQLAGDNLSITNNGTATSLDLSKYLDDTQISEADLLNLLVNNGYITQTALNTYLTSNGYLTAEMDGSVTNEIQDLQLSSNNLSITNNGSATTIDLSPYLDNTDTQLTEEEVDAFANNNGYLTAENNAFATSAGVTSNAPGSLATDDFVFGSTSLNDVTGTDDDARMFFDKSKGAFRAGSVVDVRWNDANVGSYSFATGVETRATNTATTAMGVGTNATGVGSTALGNGSQAFGRYSTAMGQGSTASGQVATAMGFRTTAGDYSTAMGYQTTADGEFSTAMGFNTTASGLIATAMGSSNIASGDYSTAMGYYTIASSESETAIGRFNTNSSARLFVIGNGTADASRSDALIILKSGATTLNGALTIDADNVGGSDGYTLPVQDGANGQVMTTDGSGVVSWSSAASSGAFATASNITSNSPGTMATDDFVFGSTSLDDIAGTDDDNRMFFDKSKGAFRVGIAVSSEWNDANVGIYSFASGYATTASGSYSFSTGAGSNASGDYSFAAGVQSQANGDFSFASGDNTIASSYSFASGFETNASGISSFAVGVRTEASGPSSFASGFETIASGSGSLASGSETKAIGSNSIAWGERTEASLGNNTTAWGERTVAMSNNSTAWGVRTTAVGENCTVWGFGTDASGEASTAWGRETKTAGDYSTAWGIGGRTFGIGSTTWGDTSDANGDFSTAWGLSTDASGAYSTTWGYLTRAPSYNETALGTYNTLYTPANVADFNSNDRLFVIGNGTAEASRSDALIIFKNGNGTLAGSLTQSSDLRLKKDIAPLNESFTNITQLTGVHYKWNEVKPHDTESLQTGLIAQEVEKLFPELVTEGSEGYKSVNYIGLVPHLIEAIKELKKENEALKTAIDIQKNTFEERLSAIEKMLENK